MKRLHTSVLMVLVAFAFDAAGAQAQGVDPDYFQALTLLRFSPPVDLPDVSLPDLEGKMVSLRSWRGKVLLLNFWTTW